MIKMNDHYIVDDHDRDDDDDYHDIDEDDYEDDEVLTTEIMIR